MLIGKPKVILEDKTTKNKEEKIVIYCRVSSSAQRNTTLITQKDRVVSYCMAKGYKINNIIMECGSGLNDSRKH